MRDANETFLDFNQNGVYDGPDGKYSGVLCDNVTPLPREVQLAHAREQKPFMCANPL